MASLDCFHKWNPSADEFAASVQVMIALVHTFFEREGPAKVRQFYDLFDAEMQKYIDSNYGPPDDLGILKRITPRRHYDPLEQEYQRLVWVTECLTRSREIMQILQQTKKPEKYAQQMMDRLHNINSKEDNMDMSEWLTKLADKFPELEL